MDILWTENEEFLLQRNNEFIIGISDLIFDTSEEVIFVELPEVGTHFNQFDWYATIETTGRTFGVAMPVSGTIVDINHKLINNPVFVKKDIFNNGYLAKITPDNIIRDVNSLISGDERVLRMANGNI